MVTDVCIFEDEEAVNFHPLTWTRPVWELRCGISTLEDKLLRYVDVNRVFYMCRDYLAESVRRRTPDARVNEIDSEACLFLNARLLPEREMIREFTSQKDVVWRNEEGVVAAFLGAEKLKRIRTATAPLADSWFAGIPTKSIVATLVKYPWDLVLKNADQIGADFRFFGRGGVIEGKVDDRATLLNRHEIYIGSGAEIKPGVVLDAESGPIYIADDVTIMANAVIEGPAYVGPKSSIKIGAKIYEGTSIGEVCKVGGEVEESIIHSYSNKQHEGFLGHAYLGQWVNIGADTNNSDLKNNYSPVRVFINGTPVDSGSLFVGLFMGDHSKTGINTMFNTGTVVGVMSNVFGAGYPPKYIPSFAWGGAEGLVEHQIERALETARRVMARRKKELFPEEEQVLREVFKRTAHERETFTKK
jgi:UDP-N-acetylglucosamine diphosphorylase/glucosamine-1-phosphate N-acetyltransferase